LQWPFVFVEQRVYLRGFDVTDSAQIPPDTNSPTVLRIGYDEAWHSDTDRERPQAAVRRDEGFLGLVKYVDDWVPPRELFEWKLDPDLLRPPPDLSLPASVIVIVRPGEIPGLPGLQ
jgi:hypothetical protein